MNNAQSAATLAQSATAQKYLAAGSAAGIPKGAKGLWYIRKFNNPFPLQLPNCRIRPAGDFTMLLRWTNATIGKDAGECVMVDDPPELLKHVQAARAASGDVLVTGLGLGCVLRMLQVNPRVERITVVEISRDVIDLVWPHTPQDRVELVHADALDYLPNCGRRWNCAWHDIWSDEDKDQPHLQVLHQQMILALHERVARQGAWAFPRNQKRALQRVIDVLG